MPSGVSKVAPTGQTCTQGDLEQWLHILGTKKVFSISSAGTDCLKPSIPPLGDSTLSDPSLRMVYCSTQLLKKKGSCGTSFSTLQVLAQVPHPIHFSISMAIPYQGPLVLRLTAAYKTALKEGRVEATTSVPAVTPAFLRKLRRDKLVFCSVMADGDYDILHISLQGDDL